MTIRSFSVLSIAAGAVLLASPLLAAEVKAIPETKTAPASVRSTVFTDVALDSKGQLRGVLVNSNGKPLSREKVVITQGRRTVGSAITNEQGQYLVSNLRPGTYQITSGKDSSFVRVWTSDSAPPSHKKLAMLVQGQTVTRAQLELAGLNGGLMGLGGLAVGGAGLGFGISGTIDAGDSNDRADSLQRRVDQLSNSP